MLKCVWPLGFVVMAVGQHDDPSRFYGQWDAAHGLTVTFRRDRTFLQTGTVLFTGKWKMQERKAVVTVDRIKNLPVDEAIRRMTQGQVTQATQAELDRIKKTFSHIEFTVSPDGKVLSQSVIGFKPATYKRHRS